MVLTILFSAILIAPLAGLAYLRFNPQFGGRIKAADQARYAQSPQWDGEKFVNQNPTEVEVNLRTLPGLIRAQLTERGARTPAQKLPVVPFDSQAWNSRGDRFQFVWYGHSVCLMKLAGKNILIDPMFGPDASPIGPVRTHRFSENTLAIIDNLPNLDVVLLTHDHYDHIDYASIEKLKDKVPHFYVALGIKRHLTEWGIAADRITEMDWWDTATIGDITITFTPSRHFSGRGLFDRAKSLWGGWALVTPKDRIYWSGDGGYDSHFKTIGDQLGPFDWAFVECGQYYKLWHQIHMYPGEAVQAAIDVGAKVATPVHWGGFSLALHTWREPVQEFVTAARRKDFSISVPRLGAITSYSENQNLQAWWEDYS